MIETENESNSVKPEPVQQCSTCRQSFSINETSVQCKSCGGLLEISHPAPKISGTELKKRWDDTLSNFANRPHPFASGVWRFHDAVMPVREDRIISHPEGNTPLLHRDTISKWTGVTRVQIKHEGHNPTGSFKDRGMAVAVTRAKEIGAAGVLCASTGNTSSSLASYASTASIPSAVLVPAGNIARGKLAQTLAYGAKTIVLDGNFDDCLKLAREASERLGWYLVNSLNPFRLEGQKTIVYELLQQRGWLVPDWIVLPAGNLGNTAAFGKALKELLEWRVIDRLPRIAAVQAEGAAPFAASFRDDFKTRHTVTPDTVATAIRIGNPASYDRAVEVIQNTNGYVTSVTDQEILEAKSVIDSSGVGCEPASAASVAGVRSLVQKGIIKSDDDVVAILTGHILKDPETTMSQQRSDTHEQITVENSFRAVETILTRHTKVWI